MLMSAMPLTAVVVAALDVVAIVTVALTAARFLSDRSQDRVVSVPKELAEERNMVCLDHVLLGGPIYNALQA